MSAEKETGGQTRTEKSTNTKTTRGDGTGGGSGAERQRDIEMTRDERKRGWDVGRPYSAAIRNPSTSPFSLMRRMAEDMDRLFEHFGVGRGGRAAPSLLSGVAHDDDFWSTPALQQSAWTPQVEVFQRGDKLIVRADLPGMTKEDVALEINSDVLTISGERKDEHEEKGDGFYRSERMYGQFYRAIPLPDGVNPDNAEATFKDGVLEISLDASKQQRRYGRRINVR